MSAPGATPRRTPAAARKRRRLYAVLAGMTMLGIAAALVLNAFEDSLVFFYSPSDLRAKEVGPERRLRLGGLVRENSIRKKEDGLVTEFEVTDLEHTVRVSYKGILPDLFREGQGVVTEGRLGADGTFVASEVLAKHDENYMPKEVADALKKSGRWKHAEEKAGK